MEKQEELWKPVVGYEDFYEVSNLGRVKSLNYNHTGKEGLMKPSPDDKGYLRVGLSKKGKKETCQVHQLVMEAFKGECPENHQVDHIDWNRKNNRLENLRYIPANENAGRKSPEWLVKMQKLYKDPEWQKNVREGAKKRSQDPKWQKNHAEAREKMYKDPEWQKNVREGVKKRSQDPKWQKNHAEAIRKRCCKPVDQYTLDGQFVKRWPSASEAVREIGGSNGSISLCCNGKRKNAGGFIWKFAV